MSHYFIECTIEKKKKTKMHSLTHILTPPLPLLTFSDPTTPLPPTTIPLPLPGIILFSFWLFVLFCIQKPIQIGFFIYVVDVMERVSNTWLFLQLRLESAISKYFSDLLLKLLISCYNTLYRENCSILLSCCCSRSRSFILYLRLEH